MSEKRIAIIPARGGSKRIPRKNIKNFLGKPIIAYSIETACDSSLFDEVMVSTDDEEIRRVAIAHGATVPFLRSAENANDTATTISVIREVLDTYHNQLGISFKYACCIYATSPLMRASHLKEGLRKLLKNNMTSVFPVTSFGYPIWRGLTPDDDNGIKMIWPEYLNSRSQDLPVVYHDAGQWYWYDTEKIRMQNWKWPDDSDVIVLDENSVQDIDSLTDWKLAELKYNLS